MKRIVLVTVIMTVLLAVAAGCGIAEPSVPGVVKISEKDCYIVQLPGDGDIHDYFCTVGASGQIALHSPGTNNVRIVFYNSTEEGGYVLFRSNDIALYIPPNTIVPQALSAACYVLINNSENYMTLNTARSYISHFRK